MLNELSVGILGSGEIGTHLAKTCKFFGMKTISFKKNPPEGEKCSHFEKSPSEGELCSHFEKNPSEGELYSHFENTHTFHNKEGRIPEELMSVDYLVNTLPHTPHTTRLLNLSLFKLCKGKTTFINVGEFLERFFSFFLMGQEM